MTKRFGGFLVSEEPSLPVPRAFVEEVLPQLADIAEVKVSLAVFDLLAERGGYEAPLAEEEVYRHAPLRTGLKRLGSPKEPDESIGRGLELAVSRGTLLRFVADHGGRRRDSWYLLNTPRNRETLGKMARGVLSPPAALRDGHDDGAGPLIEPERPNIFRLYEQNVGILTPLIADQLRDAENTYPPTWVEEAFREAVAQNRRSWRYIQKILERWANEGRTDGTARRDPPGAAEQPASYWTGRYGHLIRH